MAYYMRYERPAPITRKASTSQPYRFQYEGQEYTFNFDLIQEQDFYNTSSDTWEPWTQVKGYTIPDCVVRHTESVYVWHVDNPCDMVELRNGVKPDGGMHLGMWSGQGSLLLLGDLNHYQEPEYDDE